MARDAQPRRKAGSHQGLTRSRPLQVQAGSGSVDAASRIWPEARVDRANATISKYGGRYFCEIVCLRSYIPQVISDVITLESQDILSQIWSGRDYGTPCRSPAVGDSWAASAQEQKRGLCDRPEYVSTPPGSCSGRTTERAECPQSALAGRAQGAASALQIAYGLLGRHRTSRVCLHTLSDRIGVCPSCSSEVHVSR